MAQLLKEVEVAIVGMGWTGAIMARELTRAGLQVVGLERGRDVLPREEFALPGIRDELRYATRLELMQDASAETVTFRHQRDELALPMRRLGSFLPGEGVGGAGNHWGGHVWRYLPSDHVVRSSTIERYGAGAIPEGMTLSDWPISYADLEPYYDRFERLCGVSGKAGNLRGRKVAGGNVFEGPRRSDYPNPPLKPTLSADLFTASSTHLGYHPFPQPAALASQPYINSEGIALGACQYCGFCDRIGCESNAKAGPQTTLLPKLREEPNFELRVRCWASKLLYDAPGRRVTGVQYTDMRTGEEFIQPATTVILSAYVFGNVGMLLNSGISKPYDPATGSGVVGRNYCYQLSRLSVPMFFEHRSFNPFMASPGSVAMIDDFNGDNFDHSGLGFLGGARIGCGEIGGMPIGYHPTPPGTPKWGSDFKRATKRWYQHSTAIIVAGSNYAHRNNYLDLDPTYRDALGRPLVRMTYNFVENDRRLMRFALEKATTIATAMRPTILAKGTARTGDYDIRPYQSTHNSGGTIMGTNPSSSVVNGDLQCWDAANLYVLGASVIPQQPSYNPTGVIAALAYRSAEAILRQRKISPAYNRKG